MRVATTLLVTVGLVASLAACSSTPTPDSATGDCAVTTSGSASDSVKVTGDFGSVPKIDFDLPIDPKSTE